MVRLWWLWWPQPARPPPQRWHQAAEHSEAPPRGCAATAPHHMARKTRFAKGFISVPPAVVADPPPTARHGSGSGWPNLYQWRKYAYGRLVVRRRLLDRNLIATITQVEICHDSVCVYSAGKSRIVHIWDLRGGRSSLKRALDRRLCLLIYGLAYGTPKGQPV
ncbi:hypothetical protein Tco_1466867 [Tanacetum coccineum]